MWGTGVGFLGLTLVVLHFFLGPFAPPRQSPGSAVGELAREVAAGLVGKTTLAQSQPMNVDQVARAVGLILAVSALGLGVVGFIRREDPRPSAAAVALGTAAILFQLAVLALAAVILVAIVGSAIHAQFQ